jgi:hypothetical protein
MITHPMIGDLSSKTLEELQETINNLNNKVAFMSRMHNQTMMNQLIMALNSYRTEYSKRQEEMWNKKSEQLKGKIDISNNP